MDKQHVLVVEDDRLLQRLYRRMFGKTHHLTIVDNADDAIRALQQVFFHFVLCDWDLRGNKNGGHVRQWVADNQPGLLKNFAFVTANPDVAERFSCAISKTALTNVQHLLQPTKPPPA